MSDEIYLLPAFTRTTAGQACVGYDYEAVVSAPGSVLETDSWWGADTGEGSHEGHLASEAGTLPEAITRRLLGGADMEARKAASRERAVGVAAAAAAQAVAVAGAGSGAGAWSARSPLAMASSAEPLALAAAELAAAERGAGLSNPYVAVFDVSVRFLPLPLCSLLRRSSLLQHLRLSCRPRNCAQTNNQHPLPRLLPHVYPQAVILLFAAVSVQILWDERTGAQYLEDPTSAHECAIIVLCPPCLHRRALHWQYGRTVSCQRVEHAVTLCGPPPAQGGIARGEARGGCRLSPCKQSAGLCRGAKTAAPRA